jgi:ankyrin repeat protein
MIRSSLLASAILALALGSSSAGGVPAGPLPDTTPPGKPHFDTKGAKVGDQLPNLPMRTLDGKETSLAEAWSDGPTLLLTSSYTCPKSRATYPQAAELARRAASRGVRVAIVYVIEAHPAGDPSPYTGTEEVTAENRHDQILCRQPRTLEQRLQLANEFANFATHFKPEIPIYVDAMDNAAWSTLGGGPNMGVLVDNDGIVIARQGWFDAASMETAIDAFVEATPKTQATTQPDEATEKTESTLRELVTSNKARELGTILNLQPELERRPLGSCWGKCNLLQTAAQYGQLDVVKLLTRRGADVNRQDGEFATPLHLAAEGGYVEVARFLLEHGADVNAKDGGHGPTPLQVALLARQSAVAALLVKAGAASNFYTAAATGDLAALRRGFLDDPTTISRPDGRGRSALVYAVATGQAGSARLLLSLGARDFPADYDEREAAWWAVNWKCRDLEMTRLLLDAGSDPNLFTWINDTLPIDFVRTMLEHKADPNHVDGRGLRPLHSAAAYDRRDILQLLLDAGADVNGVTADGSMLFCGPKFEKGDTPMNVAARNGHPKSVEFLLTHGAKVNAVNDEGQTALNCALGENNPDVAEQIARLLIDHHADVNAADKEGRTPLDIVIEAGRGSSGLFAAPADDRPMAPLTELLKKHGAVKGKTIAPTSNPD